ncbi:hypothetical protein EG329_001743 [Mollisiaceae sp. DMI_Dod_QoI]|nr:hypothetical protein EG329_001743 [Helotiales sp. DMI_Dod_QoI]
MSVPARIMVTYNSERREIVLATDIDATEIGRVSGTDNPVTILAIPDQTFYDRIEQDRINNTQGLMKDLMALNLDKLLLITKGDIISLPNLPTLSIPTKSPAELLDPVYEYLGQVHTAETPIDVGTATWKELEEGAYNQLEGYKIFAKMDEENGTGDEDTAAIVAWEVPSITFVEVLELAAEGEQKTEGGDKTEEGEITEA